MVHLQHIHECHRMYFMVSFRLPQMSFRLPTCPEMLIRFLLGADSFLGGVPGLVYGDSERIG